MRRVNSRDPPPRVPCVPRITEREGGGEGTYLNPRGKSGGTLLAFRPENGVWPSKVTRDSGGGGKGGSSATTILSKYKQSRKRKTKHILSFSQTRGKISVAYTHVILWPPHRVLALAVVVVVMAVHRFPSRSFSITTGASTISCRC